MKLICQYMAIFFNFSLNSSHIHPLQVENCDSNSRLVVDEDDNGKFRLERVNSSMYKRGIINYDLALSDCPLTVNTRGPITHKTIHYDKRDSSSSWVHRGGYKGFFFIILYRGFLMNWLHTEAQYALDCRRKPFKLKKLRPSATVKYSFVKF